MIYIYAIAKPPRLTYVLDFCFTQKDQPYELISDLRKWEEIDGTKLNYSSTELDCDYAIEPTGILGESDIDPNCKIEVDGEFFKLRGSKDMLSLIFYMLVRYEEYQDHQKDEHGRFLSDQSQQKELGILETPIVDRLVWKLWRKLGLDYKRIQDKFELVPSFDIDIAWAYKHRPLWRKLGAFKNGKLIERIAVLLGQRKDPYDTYSKITEISAQLNRIICFAPVADYAAKDKNIDWKNLHYQSLLRGLNSSGGMGLHPGYASHLTKEKIEAEKERMEQILGHEMEKSRFHFLRFEIPKSYQMMIKLGFKKEYSMGYSDAIGFRAGTAFPHYFFDLQKDQQMDYLIFPFVYMDNALKDKMKLTPQEAKEKIEPIMQEVKDVGGVFMCIWHNHSINDKGEWKGWLDVLDQTVKWGKQSK